MKIEFTTIGIGSANYRYLLDALGLDEPITAICGVLEGWGSEPKEGDPSRITILVDRNHPVFALNDETEHERIIGEIRLRALKGVLALDTEGGYSTDVKVRLVGAEEL
jgi:hypothetical protein